MQDELLLARARKQANKMVSYFMSQPNGLWHLIATISKLPRFEGAYEEELRKELCEKASSSVMQSGLSEILPLVATSGLCAADINKICRAL